MKKILSLLIVSLYTAVVADELSNNPQNMQQNSAGVKFVITNNSGKTLYNFRIRSAIYNQWVELGKILSGENNIEVSTELNEKTVGTFEFQTDDRENKDVYMLGGYSYNPDHSVNITLGNDLKYNLQVQRRDENNKVLKYTNSNAELSTIKDSLKDISMYMACEAIGFIYGGIWCQGTDINYKNSGFSFIAYPYTPGKFSSTYDVGSLIGMGKNVSALSASPGLYQHIDFKYGDYLVGQFNGLATIQPSFFDMTGGAFSRP